MDDQRQADELSNQLESVLNKVSENAALYKQLSDQCNNLRLHIKVQMLLLVTFLKNWLNAPYKLT